MLADIVNKAGRFMRCQHAAVWTSCSAHALAHMDRFTEFHKGLWSIPGAQAAVEKQFFPDQRFCQVFLDIIIRLSVFSGSCNKHPGRCQAAPVSSGHRILCYAVL